MDSALFTAKSAMALNSAKSGLNSAYEATSRGLQNAYESATDTYDHYTGQASYQQQPQQSSSAYSSASYRSARPSAGLTTTDRLRAEYTRPERRRAESPEPTAAGGWSSSIKKAVWGEQDGTGRPATVARSNSSNSVGTWDTSRWQKMMDSAYTATSNVSAKFVSRVTGNEEPSDEPGPDGDTHLTRVIKEYHISKATSSNDLPTWLFPRQQQPAASKYGEAGPTRSRPSAASRPAATLDPYAYSASSISSSGSSSMFDETGRHGPSSSMSSTTSSQRAYGATPSSAANRLKAMRDEKRAR